MIVSLLLHLLVVFVAVDIVGFITELFRFGALIIQSFKCWELASYNET